MSLEVRQMRHVLALRRARQFRPRGDGRGAQPVALSRSIQSVEREAGSQLFVPHRERCRADRQRPRVIARIHQIVQLTEDLDRDLVGDRGLQSGQLHVGRWPVSRAVHAHRRARPVRRGLPRVVVRVMMRDWDELLRRAARA